MPKNNKITKIANVIHKSKVPAKLRIGTRKSGTSAHTMSNAALLTVLSNKNQSKYHTSARTVLDRRGLCY